MDEPADRHLSQMLSVLQQGAHLSLLALQLDLHRYWSAELAKPRYDDPRSLSRHGYKVYSQFDEDGIIDEVFRRIGSEHRTFVEFGVETGVECNTLKLLVEGWRGLWIENGKDKIERIGHTHQSWLTAGQLQVTEALVTAENIDELIMRAKIGPVDLLSIDIDSNDFWVWQAINSIQPRLVVIEYNAVWRPPMASVVPYDPARSWSGNGYYGASLEALARLAARKGYRLVGCSFSGVNAFFVRADLCRDHFLSDAATLQHYEPARYFMVALPAGHPPEIGPLVTIS